MSRWLLVELEEDLAKLYTTRTGVFVSVKQVNGVRSVTDVSAISKRTADEWLKDVYLPADQVLIPKRRPGKNGAT
ncbi:MAG TPA: hypothetical protein VFB50_06475 [Chloroflexota bacterium]|nr:hypothetical protein [Chloroflexota bacterium]